MEMAVPVDVKNQRKTFKAASLMGPRSGLPTLVESDEEGKITRIRPVHYEDYTEWEGLNPWRIEAKGKTLEAPRKTLPAAYYLGYKKRVYSENRVKWPLKRVDWDPCGERNPENRGKSKYVRISWDEATDIIAGEIKRVGEKYGLSAILAEADMHGEGKHVAPSHGCMNRLLSILGGYTSQMRNMDSWEGYAWGSKHVWGCEPVGQVQPSRNVWPDIAKNAETLLFWAADPEVTSVGFDGYMASRLSYWIHSLGHKYIHIDPFLNYSGVCQADKWIPVYANTDAALELAIAHVWLEEGLYDKEYVATHAVGAEPFFDYVLGKAEDGIAKTPEWASGKCGVPEWTIKALARHWHKAATSVTIGNGGPGIRGPYSHEHCRLQSILMGMQGLCRPGRDFAKWLEWNLHSKEFAMPYQGESLITIPHRAETVRPPGATFDLELIKKMNERGMSDVGAIDPEEMLARISVAGQTGGVSRFRLTDQQRSIEELVEICNPIPTPPTQSIPKCMVHDAILKDGIEWDGLWSFCGPAAEQWDTYRFPAAGGSRIHMVWTDSPCMVTCWNDGFNFVKALRSEEIEFVLAQHQWLENDCCLADIILPVQTKFEMEDICDDQGGGIVTSVFHEYPACPPVGESLDDFDCVAEVARKISEEAWRKYTANGRTGPECIDLFWEGSNVSHLDKEDSFHKKGIFVIPCDTEVRERPPQLRLFAEDPENNPLSTPTGKLEFTSTGLREHFPDDQERPPYPVWIEKGPSHDESLSSARAEDYPLLCVSNHGRWRFHANLDDVTWQREIETMKIRGKDGYQYEPVWLHPDTAAECGVGHGDIVKVYNERGTVLCAAYVSERIVQKTAFVDHGARFDPIDAETLDRGGAINLISPHGNISKHATGMVVSGYLVAVEKVSDEEMEGWKAKYPEAFARRIDEGCGVCLDGWLEER